MNTIGAAIDRGEINVQAISWEEFKNLQEPPCCYDCRFVGVHGYGIVECTLFDRPYNSVESVPANLVSCSSLMSVITKCSLKEAM